MLSLVEAARIGTFKAGLRQFWHVSLYANALYLLIANAANTALGFIFWIVVVRVYSPEDVGLASALLASMGLLVLFSRFGLGWGLIRFLPHSGGNADSLINTILTIDTLASLAVASVFVAGLSLWSPALIFLRHNPVYLAGFVLFTIASSLSILMDHAFIASRRAGLVLAKGIIFGLLKIPLPVVLAAYSRSFGIFASWGVSLWAALFFSFFLFLSRVQPRYRPRFTISHAVLKEIVPFSFANYIGTLLLTAPAMSLPLIAVNLLSAESTAYLYVALTVGSVLTMLPAAVSTSLFAEGSHEEEKLRLHAWRSLRLIFFILVPALILMLVIADKLLLLFGEPYAENATTLLRIMAIAALPTSVNVVYLAMKRVEKKLRVIVGLNAFVATVTLGLTCLLLPRMGINGAGIAVLTSQGIIALVIVAGWLKGKQVVKRAKVFCT